jgi:putative ABC transport system permease protein
MATEFKKHVGDRIDLPVRPKDAPADFVNHPFTVVGIFAKTGTGPDTTAFVSDADARMLLSDSLAPPVRAAVDVNQVAESFTVYPKAGTSLAGMDAIADRINAQVPGVKASRPSDLINSFQSINSTLDAVIIGSAVLALVIGSLSVVNTMIMAVTERVREIGLKKALGAHTGHVLREYLLEASLIGLIGGGLGFLLGAGLTSLIAAFGQSLFLITPRLTVLSIGFAVVLGALAGLVPAIRAARLDPVSALRTSN